MMFNQNTTWMGVNDFHRRGTLFLSCMILMGRIATAQNTLQLLEVTDTRSQSTGFSQLGTSMPSKRIASVTCDPFMTPSQEQALITLLHQHDDSPWLDYSLQKLRDRLSNSCTVLIDERSIEEANVDIDQPLMKETPVGRLGARLSALLNGNSLTYSIRQNRLEIASDHDTTMGVRRIYDVTPLVQTIDNGQDARSKFVEPLYELIEATISPDCWQNAGGTCLIREFIPPNNRECVCLIILNATENHFAIQSLLDQLNSVAAPRQSSSGLGLFSAEPLSNKFAPTSQIKRWQADRLDAGRF